MSEEECLIAHTLCNMPEDPEKMKEHVARMRREIEELKINLNGALRVIEKTDLYIELQGRAWEFGVAILNLILGC